MVRNEHNSTASLWRLTRFSLMNALLMMTVVASQRATDRLDSKRRGRESQASQ
jgi:hypothetical protein